MKTKWGLLLTSLLIVASSDVATAVTTYSPPVRSSEGDNLGCFVQNLGDRAVEVESEINNGLGTIVDTATLNVPAGQSLQLARTSGAVFGAYCIFTFEGDPSEVRGFVSLQDAGGSNTRLLLPAASTEGQSLLQAKTFTPPVRSSEGDNLGCFLQNLSDNPVQVVSEIDNGLGTIVDTATLTVPASQSLQLARTNGAVFGAYCIFTFEGSPKEVRGFISLQDAGGSNTRLLFPATLASALPPASPTPTATPAVPACCGDCDGDSEVKINELIRAVGYALDGCPEP